MRRTSNVFRGLVFGAIVVAMSVIPAISTELLLAQNLAITEVMADNDGTVLDADGEDSDWFEVGNLGNSSVNLAGWAVTDDPGDLFKWVFPSRTLAAGEFMLVFASEKDRRTIPYHTSFRMTSAGEFLALVDPEGNIVHSYFPDYGPQFTGISYGHPQGGNADTLIAEGADCRALIPSQLISGWRSVSYNDGAWTAGTTGVGYDQGSDYGSLIGLDVETEMQGVNPGAYIRVPFVVTDAQDYDAMLLRMKYDDGFLAYLNGTEIARRNAPGSPIWSSSATAEHGEAQFGSMDQDFDGGGTSFAFGVDGENFPPAVVGGGPTGSYLELIQDDTGSLSNSVGFARTFGASNLVVVEFDYRMPTEASHTGCCAERADGFGFALISTAEYGNSGPGPVAPGVVWERPTFPDALCVGFDIFDNGSENTVSLNWNGAQVAAQLFAPFELNNGVFNRVRVELNSVGGSTSVTVQITPNIHGSPGTTRTVFDGHVIPGMEPFDARLAFGGRTGGAYTYVHLDNINAQFTAGSPEIQFEEIDVSEHVDLLQNGGNVLAIHGLNISSNDDDFLMVPELVATQFSSLDLATTHYFTSPTPGAPNTVGFPDIAEEPQLSHSSRAYSSAFSLTMSVTSPTARIHYTTNGSIPTESSTEYTGPISINTTRLIRARTFDDGVLPSTLVEANFVLLQSNVSSYSSNLPIVILDSYGSGIGSSSFTRVTSMFIDTIGNNADITDFPSFAGTGGLKIRGSSSQGFPKKQWAFEAWDEHREDKDVQIFDFPMESDYILYAPYSDKSLMRNFLTYKWSRDMGEWSVKTRFVEVFINTGGGSLSSADYNGVYVFMEKIKRGGDRVDIARLAPGDNSGEEVTGGYILKHDRLDPGDNGFSTSRGYRLAYVYPKEEEVTSAQSNYIRGYINQFEGALYGANFRDPVNGYRRYIDTRSFIDAHLLVEMAKNIDGYRLSFFMYKDKNDKLHMGPAWDYNLSLGNADYLEGFRSTGWYYNLINDGAYIWYRRLFQDPDFAQEHADRWNELRSVTLNTSRLLLDVDEARSTIGASATRNFNRWNILGTRVWPNWFIADTWAEELAWMRGWINDRTAWIDSTFLSKPRFNHSGGALPVGGHDLTMAAGAGTVWYTLNGDDPRLSGGAVSPSAIAYGAGAQAVLVSPDVTDTARVLVPTSSVPLTWRSRTFNDSSWDLHTNGIGVGYETGSGYESFIDIDVEDEMVDTTTTVMVRIPFTVADASEITSLTFRMMYDDGFVAYINDQQIASANAPASPSWDDGATAQHDDAAAVVFQPFVVSQTGVNALVDGTNILAIHGLNFGSGSSDMLLVPELIGAGTAEGDPVPILEPSQVIARTQLGGQWSAPAEVVFVEDQDLPLRITEIMYHPPTPPEGSSFGDNDFEFIEVKNISGSTISLLGVKFAMGITFDFSHGDVRELAPGQLAVVVENREAFESLYGAGGILIAGEYDGNLENMGERIILRDGRNQIIHDFTFSDLWYPQTDGGGFSLHIVDPGAGVENWGLQSAWQASAFMDGSPGEDEGDIPPGGWQRPGDANQDAFVEISDAIAYLNHLFLGVALDLPCDGATVQDGGNATLLDLDGASGVNLTDVLYLLNYLFLSGPEPDLGEDCVRIEGCPTTCF